MAYLDNEPQCTFPMSEGVFNYNLHRIPFTCLGKGESLVLTLQMSNINIAFLPPINVQGLSHFCSSCCKHDKH